MTDELEIRLRNGFRQALPAATEDLRRSLDRLPPRRQGARAWLVSIAAALVILAFFGIAFVASLPGTVGSSPTYAPTSSGVSTSTATPAPTQPISKAMTVSEFKERLANGERGGSMIITGYWTDRLHRHGCAAPDSQPGALELYCMDGEFGITELPEPIQTVMRDNRVLPPVGPVVTPFIEYSSGERERLFGLPVINGQLYPPVPIVVRGHVDDPRAADCRPAARPLCADRLVIDEVISFDRDAVPTPGITAPPSPFPVGDPPPPKFGPDQCPVDGPYSYVGWIRLSQLGFNSDVRSYAYAMVTRDPQEISPWAGEPGSEERRRQMGRVVCWVLEYDETGVIRIDPLPGTQYIEYEDGTTVPIKMLQ